MSQPISLHTQNFSLWHEIQLVAEGSGATTPLLRAFMGGQRFIEHYVACLSAQGEVSW